jgi:GTP-binding protein
MSRALLLVAVLYLCLEVHVWGLSLPRQQNARIIHTQRWANPVNSEGSNLRGDITEMDAFQWFDEAMIHVRAGSGGPGSSAVKFGKARQHIGVTGGSGGTGGSVIFTVDPSTNTLMGFRGKTGFRAENGQPGDLEYANGLNGKHFQLAVPRGTTVIDNSTNEVIGELTRAGQELVVAHGGIGGRGNAAMKTKGERSTATPPQGGERKWLKLELKLVADVGLVGVPNAGKSTLLDAVTNARPKIASYPFTTIVPNLGVCRIDGGRREGGEEMVIADIPGLLEGAHQGVGLGRGFLRHIERCKMIIHIVNGDSQDPVGDFKAINRELQLFSPGLATKPQVVVLNKIDVPEVAENQERLMAELRACMGHSRLLAISAAGRMGVGDLMERTGNFLNKIKEDEARDRAARRAKQQRRVNDNSEDVDEDDDDGEYGDAATAAGSCEVRCISESLLELSGPGAQMLREETSLMAEGRHYYGAEQRLRAVVEALDVSGLAEEAYKEFRSRKEQVVAPLPRKMALRYEGERLGVLVDGTIVPAGDGD